MAKKSRAGNSYKTQYKSYSTRNAWYRNKEARLERQIKKNPNDSVAIQALENLQKSKTQYSRNKKSNSKGWFNKQEIEINKEIASKETTPNEKAELRNKLEKIRYIRNKIIFQGNVKNPELNMPIPAFEQLFNIGVIDEKRRKLAETRMARVFQR